MDCYFGINGFHHINTTKRVQHNFMMHPLVLGILLICFWKRQYTSLRYLVSLAAQQLLCSCISAAMRSHNSCCALAYQLLCARTTGDVHAVLNCCLSFEPFLNSFGNYVKTCCRFKTCYYLSLLVDKELGKVPLDVGTLLVVRISFT